MGGLDALLWERTRVARREAIEKKRERVNARKQEHASRGVAGTLHGRRLMPQAFGCCQDLFVHSKRRDPIRGQDGAGEARRARPRFHGGRRLL